MNRIERAIRAHGTIVLPGVYDALTARLAESSGFDGVCIGGAAIGATQLGVADLGLQTFQEYRESVARVLKAIDVPSIVDAEDGFGEDPEVVFRTVADLLDLGADAIVIEDLVPARGSCLSRVAPPAQMQRKLEAALRCRDSHKMRDAWIVGRTDAWGLAGGDEALQRARLFESIGVDAILVTGMENAGDMQRLRDTVSTRLVAPLIETKPWAMPDMEEVRQLGFELALYPATVMLRALEAARLALAGLKAGCNPRGTPKGMEVPPLMTQRVRP